MASCPRCGEENPGRARFCLACGAPLPSAEAEPGEVRKTVTIVFCDVTGSTALGERLDPESLRRVMARYFETMRSTLELHGGTVEKFIGDAVMAVFGIPTLHEDDALRAVRAAAEMRERLERLNEELERDRGVRIETRTGLSTGEVVAGDAASGQSFATGDTVNLASRLETAAEPGEILIDAATYGLVRDAVEVEPVAPLELKGKSRPVEGFRLLEVRAGAAARTRRLDAPMVGRGGERALLDQAFERVVREQASHLFTVLGSAGVGKSRLVAEFLSGRADDASVLAGRCLPYGEGITYWPLAEALQGVELDLVLQEDQDAGRIRDLVAQALGTSSSSATAEEVFWGVRKLLEALARERALVVVFDDVHWAEPTFLDLVEHVADWSREAPILILCVARPDLLDVRTGWGGGKLNATSILLEPLNEDEIEALIENLLGRVQLAEEARRRITDAAEGNPLFVEEMVGMLIDDGLLKRENGGWRPTADLAEITVPPTIHALLAARLDRLQGPERSVIQRASVEGKVFHRGAVQELCEGAEVGPQLQTLMRKELVRPDRAGLAGQDAFRFRHLLIRDAAYEALSKQLRAKLHERYAAWLEQTAAGSMTEFDEILGYHLEQAYRYRAELGPVDEAGRALGARAAELLAEAGRRAFARSDLHAAAKLLGRAVNLLDDEDLRRPELLLDLGEALRDKGEFVEAEAALRAALDFPRVVEAVRARARFALLMLELNVRPGGKTDEIRREVELAIPELERLGDDRTLGQAWGMLGFVHLMACRAAAMEEAFEHSFEHARRAGDRRGQSDALSWWLSAIWFGRTSPNEILRRSDELRGLGEGDRAAEPAFLITQAVAQAMSGNLEEARRLLRESRVAFQDLGLLVLASGTAFAWGIVELTAGDPVTAEREIRWGYDLLERMGERGFLSTLAPQLAEALYRQGRYDEAEELTRVGEQASVPDDLASEAYWRTMRAKVLARRGELGEADAMSAEAVRVFESSDFLSFRGDLMLDRAEVLQLAGRLEESREAVEAALRLYEEKGNEPSAERARVRLGELSSASP